MVEKRVTNNITKCNTVVAREDMNGTSQVIRRIIHSYFSLIISTIIVIITIIIIIVSFMET